MIFLYFSEAFRIYKRSPLATLVVIIITTLSILLGVSSYIVINFSKYYSDRLKSNIEINAYIDEIIDSSGVMKIESEILNKKFVKSVKYISKEDALESFIKETGEDFRTLLDYNPLPRSFSIKLNPEQVDNNSFTEIINSLGKIDGVSELIYDYEFITRILSYIRSGQYVLYGGTLILLILSLYLIYTNSRIQYESNKELYQTMKLVGAKLSSLKIPIIIYGLTIGLASSVISVLIYLFGTYLWLKLFENNIYFVIGKIEIIQIIFSMGAILGFLGSYLTARRLSLNLSQETV